MNTAKLRSKRILIPAIAAVAALGVGGGVWAATASDEVRGEDRDRVGAAAVDVVGGGTVLEVETSDDQGEAYEVEIRKDDGTEVEVVLDQDLGLVREEADDDSDGTDADDRALTDEEPTSAEDAALEAVGDGAVVEKVEASDDQGEAYEVDVVDADGKRWDVTLDADFTVLDKKADD